MYGLVNRPLVPQEYNDDLALQKHQVQKLMLYLFKSILCLGLKQKEVILYAV